jgi:hypothetical protein
MAEKSNETDTFEQDRFEIVCGQVIFELICSALLFTLSYYTYKGIEIKHPVYAVIFCDLIVALATSLANAVIFPFMSTYKYTNLSNGSNMFCLIFHSCCWCILSIQRYVYITKKAWLEEKFPDLGRLLKVSLLSLMTLVTLNVTSYLVTIVYFGYPQVKVMDTSLEHKIACVMVLLCYFVGMFIVSCWCYFEILRKRGKLGHNIVDIIDNENISQVNSGGIFIVENVNQEISTSEDIEMRNFAMIQSQSFINQQEAEIESAILSLKTNLCLFVVLVFVFLSIILISNDGFAVIFSILAKLVHVLTGIFNYAKMRNLIQKFLEECLADLISFKNKMCCNIDNENN